MAGRNWARPMPERVRWRELRMLGRRTMAAVRGVIVVLQGVG
jgi:hypothetical protein